MKELGGWIRCKASDREHLVECGCRIISPFDEANDLYEIRIAFKDISKLKPFWENRYLWGLRPVGAEDANDRYRSGEDTGEPSTS